MSQVEIGLYGIIVLVILLLIGMHVGFALILIGFVGYALVGGFSGGISQIALVPWDKLTNYSFSVMPLFVLMSAFISSTGIGADAYYAARAWFGKIRGGLAMATIVACGLFAACCGTSMAGTLVMGKIAHPEMKKLGYDDRLSCGIISAGGTLGILIPPSMAFVLIGILTNLSIGRLFMAGIFPGILVILSYITTIITWNRINPNLAPGTTSSTFKEKITSIRLTWGIMVLFLLVMGGIYFGIFTPTEAAGIGAFGAFIIGLAKRQMTGKVFWATLMDSAKMTATMMMMLVGAFMFNSFLTITQIPNVVSEWMAVLPLPSYGILAVILIFYIIVGCFLDIYAILILTIPILYPAMAALHFDLIWYSVLMVRIVEIGNITPPFGLNLFAMATVVNVPMSKIIRGVIPFILTDFVSLIILAAFPIICTFLPSIMYK
jgi:C4-dicarboxylate transporter, DctM subunit